MGRSLVALGLLGAAVLLLGSLFAELEDSIQDPDPYAPDQKAVQKAAETAAAHPEFLEAAAEAGAFEVPPGTEITIPPGAAEIDGDTLRLLQDLEWTLPAGTDVQDLTLPVPPGTSIDLPVGTEVRGDTLFFPPGSSIVLADGTVLEMPEGGRLRVPGADPDALAADVRDGTFTVPPSGSIFTSPHVRNLSDWPVTLPDGTTLRIPDGYTLPEGTWKDGGTIRLPEGHAIDPDAVDAPGETKEGLFERIGRFQLKPEPPAEETRSGTNSGSGLPGIPGGAIWYWLLGALAAAALAYLAWRHRARLRRAFAGPGTPLAATPRRPLRLIATIDGRPDPLPLAVAPHEARTLRLRFEKIVRDPESKTARWSPAGSSVEMHCGDDRIFKGAVPAEGAEVALPALAAGDHTLVFDVRVSGHKPIRLEETLRVAPWAEQVARDYDRLAAAVSSRTRLPQGFTPRVLEQHARQDLPNALHGPLAASLTVFERANYSQKTIDEADWLRVAQTVARLEHVLRGPDAAHPGSMATRRAVEGA